MWHWRDEGSGHLPVLRTAMLTGTALEVTFRTDDGGQETTLLKPYGVVWKAGEWHMVAAWAAGPPQRYRLNLVDRPQPTDLTFAYPEDFTVSQWWTAAMEDYGKGNIRVELHITPAARAELLRLSPKSTSQIHEHDDNSVTIMLYADRWEWLIPLVTSYGPDVTVTEPPPGATRSSPNCAAPSPPTTPAKRPGPPRPPGCRTTTPACAPPTAATLEHDVPPTASTTPTPSSCPSPAAAPSASATHCGTPATPPASKPTPPPAAGEPSASTTSSSA